MLYIFPRESVATYTHADADLLATGLLLDSLVKDNVQENLWIAGVNLGIAFTRRVIRAAELDRRKELTS